MTARRIVAVGGSDAGISAALRARELDPGAQFTVVVADAYPNFSICGIPYYVSGEVTHWSNLAHRTATDLAATGMEVLTDTRATRINAADHTLDILDPAGKTGRLPYDALIVGTGALSARPPIAGLHGPDALGPADGVHLLHSMGDTFAVMESLTARNPKTAAIIGAGYIGLEMAEALTTRGIAVTQIEALPEVLPTVDPDLGALIHAELGRNGVDVLTDTTVTAIDRTATGALSLTYAQDATVNCAGKQALTASGSTAQANALTHFADAYQAACPGTTLNYTANGSGAGVQEFLSGKTDFGNSDSALQGDEYKAATQRCGGSDALNIPIVFGPIAITYNLPDVNVLILDGPTLAGTFSGAITRWDDPAIEALNLPAGRAHPDPRTAMPAEEIRVIHRSDESGTTDNFQQYLQTASNGVWTRGAGKTFNGGVGQNARGNQGTAEMVQNTPGAISYNEWSSAIDQNLPTADIKTPAGVTHIGTDWDGRSIAPVTITGQGNNLVLDMTPAYTPNVRFGYPILLAGYAIVCSRYPDPETGEAVRSFLQSAITVGQTDLNKVGYIPLPTEFQSKAAEAIRSIT